MFATHVYSTHIKYLEKYIRFNIFLTTVKNISNVDNTDDVAQLTNCRGFIILWYICTKSYTEIYANT